MMRSSIVTPSSVTPLLIVAAALAGLAPAQTPQVLTSNSGPGARHPVLALDADAIAYVAMPGSTRELFVIASDGSPAVQLTTAADVHARNGTFESWAPISISDDGNIIAYWNAQGVHVLDRQNSTDIVVATTSLLPSPRLSGDGTQLVYQAPVAGDLEVFLQDAAGLNPAQQLTSNSGPGRRHPVIRGDLVLFQKLVGYEMELFAYDLTTSMVSAALTTGSGGGNRHGQLTPSGNAAVFEAVVAGVQTAMHLELATSTLTTIATGTSGSRLPQADGDDQVILQSNGAGNPGSPEVMLADPALATLSTGSRGGHRSPVTDRHGQIFVWQQENQNYMEVVALRRCWPADVTFYGTAGTPSVGAITAFETTYRCNQRLGIQTQLPPGTLALYALGSQQQSTPVANAPGNLLLVMPQGVLILFSDAQGDVTANLPLPSSLFGFTFYTQFGVLDPTANPLGITTSTGFAVQIR